MNALTSKPRVLVAEKIADEGIKSLQSACDVTVADGWDLKKLHEKIVDFDGIVIRSATKLTSELIDAGKNLQVIGRAGVGVDNVDLDAASKKGIVVVNAPLSNVLSVAEHCIGLMISLSRHIPEGDSSLRSGEWKRSKLSGTELAGKTLVLLGVGRIGQLVAERAKAFDMRVVGYDPFLAKERFHALGIEHSETIEQALKQADVLSLHMPLTPDTKGLINSERISLLPANALLINTARGGLVDLDALNDALSEGHIAGAAIDVFPTEPPGKDLPLLSQTKAIVTPHLAASTKEAQDRAGTQVAEQVVAALCGGVVTSAVNVPLVSPEDVEALQPWMPVTSRLTRLAAQLAGGAPKRVLLNARGELATHNIHMLSTGALTGLLTGQTEDTVNVVNAPHIAKQRGLEVETKSSDSTKECRSHLLVDVQTEQGVSQVGGTTIGIEAKPWLTRVLDFDVDIELASNMAFFRYRDIPGVIGKVGTAFGEADINIANMAVARDGSGIALMVVSFDEELPSGVLSKLCKECSFEFAKVVHLG